MRKRLLFTTGILVILGIGIAMRVSYVREQRSNWGVLSQCYLNLSALNLAKLLWMDENGKTNTASVSWDDIQERLQTGLGLYRMTNGRPICPQGGTYTLGRMDQLPTCSIGGRDHSLPKGPSRVIAP